jgi:hypothetical protein
MKFICFSGLAEYLKFSILVGINRPCILFIMFFICSLVDNKYKKIHGCLVRYINDLNLCYFTSSTEGMYRVIRPAVGEALREMPLVELKSKYRKVSSIDKIGNGWQEEYDASSKQVTLKLNKLIQC